MKGKENVIGMLKKYHLLMEDIQKEYLFRQKCHIRVRG